MPARTDTKAPAFKEWRRLLESRDIAGQRTHSTALLREALGLTPPCGDTAAAAAVATTPDAPQDGGRHPAQCLPKETPERAVGQKVWSLAPLPWGDAAVAAPAGAAPAGAAPAALPRRSRCTPLSMPKRVPPVTFPYLKRRHRCPVGRNLDAAWRFVSAHPRWVASCGRQQPKVLRRASRQLCRRGGGGKPDAAATSSSSSPDLESFATGPRALEKDALGIAAMTGNLDYFCRKVATASQVRVTRWHARVRREADAACVAAGLVVGCAVTAAARKDYKFTFPVSVYLAGTQILLHTVEVDTSCNMLDLRQLMEAAYYKRGLLHRKSWHFEGMKPSETVMEAEAEYISYSESVDREAAAIDTAKERLRVYVAGDTSLRSGLQHIMLREKQQQQRLSKLERLYDALLELRMSSESWRLATHEFRVVSDASLFPVPAFIRPLRLVRLQQQEEKPAFSLMHVANVLAPLASHLKQRPSAVGDKADEGASKCRRALKRASVASKLKRRPAAPAEPKEKWVIPVLYVVLMKPEELEAEFLEMATVRAYIHEDPTGYAVVHNVPLSFEKWAELNAGPSLEYKLSFPDTFLCRTPAHEAVLCHNTPALELIAKHGGCLTARDCRGQTPLHIAADKGFLDMVHVLYRLLSLQRELAEEDMLEEHSDKKQAQQRTNAAGDVVEPVPAFTISTAASPRAARKSQEKKETQQKCRARRVAIQERIDHRQHLLHRMRKPRQRRTDSRASLVDDSGLDGYFTFHGKRVHSKGPEALAEAVAVKGGAGKAPGLPGDGEGEGEGEEEEEGAAAAGGGDGGQAEAAMPPPPPVLYHREPEEEISLLKRILCRRPPEKQKKTNREKLQEEEAAAAKCKPQQEHEVFRTSAKKNMLQTVLGRILKRDAEKGFKARIIYDADTALDAEGRSPLALALARGNPEMVLALLRHGAPLEGRDEFGVSLKKRALSLISPLEYVRTGNEAMVEACYQAGLWHTGERDSFSGRTLLQWAALYACPSMCQKLMSLGEDPSAICLSTGRSAVHEAIWRGDLATLACLIHGREEELLSQAMLLMADDQCTEVGFPIHLSLTSRFPSAEVTRKIISMTHVPIHGTDSVERNIFHSACSTGRAQELHEILYRMRYMKNDKQLIGLVNDRDADSDTPIGVAVKGNHPACVEALLKSGAADLDVLNSRERHALLLAAEVRSAVAAGEMLAPNCPLRQGVPALVLLDHCTVACVQRLSGPEGEKTTAMHVAVMASDYLLCTELLAKGASIAQLNQAGKSPLRIACECGNPRMLSLLIANSRDPVGSSDILSAVLGAACWNDGLIHCVLSTSCPDLTHSGHGLFLSACSELRLQSLKLLLATGCAFDPGDCLVALMEAVDAKRCDRNHVSPWQAPLPARRRGTPDTAAVQEVAEACYLQGASKLQSRPVGALCCKVHLWDLVTTAVKDPACEWDWGLPLEGDSNRTALHYVCLYGPAQLVPALIERDPTICGRQDQWGLNALSYALQRQSALHAIHIVVRSSVGCSCDPVLLRRGVRVQADGSELQAVLDTLEIASDFEHDRQAADHALNAPCHGWCGMSPETYIRGQLPPDTVWGDADITPHYDGKGQAHRGELSIFTLYEVGTNRSMSRVLRGGIQRGIVGDNLVHWAVLQNCSILTRLLVELGTEYDVVNSRAHADNRLRIPEGAVPLWVAAAASNRSAALSLLGSPECNIDACCATGETPLGAAMRLGCLSMSRLLLQHGAFANTTARLEVVYHDHTATAPPGTATLRPSDYMRRSLGRRVIEIDNAPPLLLGLRNSRTQVIAAELADMAKGQVVEVPGEPVTARSPLRDTPHAEVSPLSIILGGLRALPSDRVLQSLIRCAAGCSNTTPLVALGLDRPDLHGHSMAEYAILAKRPSLAMRLISDGAPAWAPLVSRPGGYMLHLFCQLGSLQGTQTCLGTPDLPYCLEACVNVADRSGITPLMCAVQAPSVKDGVALATYLLRAGALVTDEDHLHRTVLIHASRHVGQSEELVELVVHALQLAYKVEVTRSQNYCAAGINNTLNGLVSVSPAAGEASTPVSGEGRHHKAAFLAHVNATDSDGYSALHHVCCTTQTRTLKVLLQLDGLDLEPGLPGLRDWGIGAPATPYPNSLATVGGYATVDMSKPLTPFLLAVMHRRELIAQALLSHCYSRSIPLRTIYINCKGETTYHWVAKNNLLYTLKALIQLERMMLQIHSGDTGANYLQGGKAVPPPQTQVGEFQAAVTYGTPDAEDSTFGGLTPLGYALLFGGMNAMQGSGIAGVLWKRQKARQHPSVRAVVQGLLPHYNWDALSNSTLSVFAYGAGGIKFLSRAIPTHEPTVNENMWRHALRSNDEGLAEVLQKGSDDMRRIRVTGLPSMEDVRVCISTEEFAKQRQGGAQGRGPSHADCVAKLRAVLFRTLRCVRTIDLDVPEDEGVWDHTCIATLKYVADTQSLLRQQGFVILRGNKINLEPAPLVGPDYRGALRRGRTSMLHIAAHRGLCRSLVVMLDAHRDEEDRELSSGFVQKLNFRDEHGYTPLHYAIAQSRHDITALLLRNGAMLTVRDVTGGLLPSQLVPSICSYDGLCRLFGKKKVPFSYTPSFDKAACSGRVAPPEGRTAFMLPGDCWDANVCITDVDDPSLLSDEDVMNMLMNDEVNKGHSSLVLQISEAALNARVDSQIQTLRGLMVGIAEAVLAFHRSHESAVLPVSGSKLNQRNAAQVNMPNEEYSPIQIAEDTRSHLQTLLISVAISTAEELSRLERIRSLTVALHGIVGGRLGRELLGALGSFARRRGVYGQRCLLMIHGIDVSFVGSKAEVGTQITQRSGVELLIGISVFCGAGSVHIEPIEDVLVRYFATREAAAASRVADTLVAVRAAREGGGLCHVPPLTAYTIPEAWQRCFALHCAGLGLHPNVHTLQEWWRCETPDVKDEAVACLGAISACLTPPLLLREAQALRRDERGEWDAAQPPPAAWQASLRSSPPRRRTQVPQGAKGSPSAGLREGLRHKPLLSQHTDSLFPSVLSDLLVKHTAFFSRKRHMHLLFARAGDALCESETALLAPSAASLLGSASGANPSDLRDDPEVVVLCLLQGGRVASALLLPTAAVLWDYTTPAIIHGLLRYAAAPGGGGPAAPRPSAGPRSRAWPEFAEGGLGIALGEQRQDLVAAFQEALRCSLELQGESGVGCAAVQQPAQQAHDANMAVFRLVFEFGADASILGGLAGVCRAWCRAVAGIFRDTGFVAGVLRRGLEQLSRAEGGAREALLASGSGDDPKDLEALCLQCLRGRVPLPKRVGRVAAEYCTSLLDLRSAQNTVWSLILLLQAKQLRLAHIIADDSASEGCDELP